VRVVIAAALVLLGCTAKPWDVHPIPVAPDRTCRTGSDAGYDVWIWECHQDRKTVVRQFCGGLIGCKDAEREDVACGEVTTFEREIAAELVECRPVPDERLWP
jgi:hypothetical protein